MRTPKVVAALLMTCFACGAFAQQKLELKVSEIWGDDYPNTKALRHMSEVLAKQSNGRIDPKVYPNGTLGSEKEVIEQVKMGALAMARVPLNLLNNICEETIVPSLPFLFRSTDHLHKSLDSAVGQEILSSCNSKGYIGLAYYDSGTRSIYAKKAVKTLADTKGMKLRVQQSDVMVAMANAMGANPSPMPMGEVYVGLRTGLIDAAENNWPSYESSKHFESAKYYSRTEHLMNPEIVIFSKVIWDKLSPADQKLIGDAAKESTTVQRKLWAEREKVSEDIVRKAGSIITEVDKKPFQDAMVPVYAKFVTSPRMKDLVKRIQDVK
ncbi:MAG: C4-dicarboxylate ABC transporter [Candidatus Dactylopiibacterium carminicum]|uniref:C4-dicarboxylate ABC transporter n=1 Tax=Candidatus Dactylopiibacterium carminicum TaxID=857335 RepID=A0A272ERR8_9RHOO|nr:TRAP transporter substrate-binding protein [Candidatus Dactylopiibacterium carminicum]KAF7598808.1 C4-dicarboxylate ABC transporter [Candidatus Dactylopiibacterium carminicum]PAS92736.1 MAG: C4-dicarboxylate ABC transporter [Candidatus Dactylopiibacterium carminicum]PAS96184.1 MAG: C4-dicarboxylate ABC transporter [Candidatus Dactylopiibacterium carminicum]PAS98829.1 MAG: C4-dicarboxylate ABC transporter [Candidatus Dactylopiibacterium carminicum]